MLNDYKANYENARQLLLSRNLNNLTTLDSEYKAKYAAIQNKSKQTVTEAKRILSEINSLDAKLSRVDKYYVKTKKKREELLSGQTSEKYAGSTDYFTALDEIKKDFNALFKKYSEDILPGLINGLNYIFSSKRKKDYEELIVLRNTVTAFVADIEEALPIVTEESLSDLKEAHFTNRGATVERQKAELNDLLNKYNSDVEALSAKLRSDFDYVMVENQLVDYLCALTNCYASSLPKVNTSATVQNEVLNMCYIDYPVDFFMESPIVAGIVKDKFAPFLTDDNVIRLPLIDSVRDTPVWLIVNDNSSLSAVQALIHSVMFGMLSSCPVAKLTYTVVDPENRGNSIAPFFDAKKKLPELFGEKIYITRDEVSHKIGELNERIGEILQERLGTRYETVFDYANDNPDYNACAELLVLFDFPKGFDEHTVAELRNILRNGSRCGIYTIISYMPAPESNLSTEYKQSLQSILELSTVINQDNENFVLRGLPLRYRPMPQKGDFDKFFSKYMLIFEGLKNRGIAFSPLIRKLADAKDSMELDEHIAKIRSMMQGYEEAYAKVPEADATFPSLVTLGSVMYPADIFSDSVGYRSILESFGAGQSADGGSGYVELPLTFDLRNSFNLLLGCPEASHDNMLAFTHHVIWSFLSFMPVTKVNVCIFDSEQRGNSVIPFLDFRKRSPDTFDQKIYTGQEAMRDRLKQINAQIDEFIQDKLGNRYKDILDYNLNTPNRAEAVTLLVLYDFPGGMDGSCVDLLTNILRNGNKCGVFTIICHNPSIAFSKYEKIDDRLEQISRYCASIDYKDGHYSLLPYNLRINTPKPLDYKTAESFISDYVERSEALKKKGLSFKDILSRDLFSENSSRSLKIPVGVGDGDSIVNITIGEGSSHHGLIAGATGSGKSTLLHTLIMSSMLHYSPDQLHLYLMDFKSGTEFKIYESVKLPHIQLLALDAMQEFGESILENLVSEMEHRGALFKEAGQTSLKGYVQATGKTMPRILVIMDEFQILFNDSTNKKVAMNCAELTKRIVTEGRAFGIHLLMATQSTKVISDLTLSHGTIEQMRIRIGLKCGESDARYLFSDENDAKALAMMKGPIGTAVLNEDYTEQPNIGFRAAYCDEKTQRYYLDLISSRYSDMPYTLQTFEGGRTTKLLDYFAKEGIGKTSELPVKIHMGTLIKVAPPFAITIDKKKKHNLLICGSNERMADTVSGNYIISALLNENSTVYFIDGDRLVGDDDSCGFYRTLEECCPRFKAANDRADIIKFVNEIYQSYLARKKQSSGDAIFVVIKNLQFLDIVKSMFKGETIDESEFMDEEPAEEAAEETFDNPFAALSAIANFTPSKHSGDDGMPVGSKLLRLIEDGSGFGISFVVTSLEYQSVRENMYYGENILTKFPERIIFSLGENDADSLIENVSVSGLRDNTVYFTDGVKNTFQLKPYVTPTADEVKKLLE